jgi:elongation factor P--(R)-beta-lysine ligase
VTFDEESSRLDRIKPHLERRARVFQLTRSFFVQQGFLEVDTPVRVPAVAPEQFITPFTSEDWFLSTSPELHMKRLLASGYDRLFQISRCFRRGERGRHHNSEFTMLEWYRRSAGYRDMMADTEHLVLFVAEQLGLGSTIPHAGSQVDLSLPWRRVSVTEAFLASAGWDPVSEPDGDRFDMDLVSRVVPSFGLRRPVILTGYPAPMAALARLNVNDARVAERSEVFVAGLELANAYSELNDFAEQRARFEAEVEAIRRGGGNAAIPSRFMEAMPFLPECAGIALGMDRLVMLMCDTDSIDDVIAFPQDLA